MRKLYNDTAKSLFIERFRVIHPQFPLAKNRKTFFPGAAVFESKASSERTGWICFGGIKDSYFVVAAGWTVSGSDPRELDEWRNPETPPTDGWVDLRNRWLIEHGAEPPYFSLDLPEPDLELQERAFSAYIESPSFEQQVRNTHRGALMICKRNPPTFDETRTQTLAAERVLFGLWGHLADRYEFAARELEGILSPIIDHAIGIAGKYGLPLIQRQLEAGAGSG